MLGALIVSTAIFTGVYSTDPPKILDCKAAFNGSVTWIDKIIEDNWLIGNVTLENFKFRKPCSFKFTIPFYSYISFDNLISRPLSSKDGYWKSNYDGNTFNTDPSASPVLIAAPYLTLTLPGSDDNSTYFIRFTILYTQTTLLNQRQYLYPKTMGELQYVQLDELLPGITYTFGDYWSMWNIRRPYSPQQQDDGLDVPLFSNILIWNGTSSAATPMGFMTCLSKPTTTNCEMGYNLQGLMLYVISPTPATVDPELSKLLIMPKPTIDAISPVFIYFIYWKRNNFNEDEAMSLTVAPPDDRSTYRLILVSQEEKPGVFEEFIFSGLTYYSEQNFPDMEILGGWPNASKPNQIAEYSNGNYLTDLPQQFGGRMRAFVIDSDSATNLSLVNPKNTMGITNASTIPDFITERWNKNFEPFLGRKGFLRTNWLDDTFAKNRSEVLKLRAITNQTVFTFQFKFESGCQSDAYLKINGTINSTTTNYGLNCTDSGKLNIMASSIQAELMGDAVVTYTVSSSRNILLIAYFFIYLTTYLIKSAS